MEQLRPSILRRPLRHTSCTKESAEEQYRREQELIAAKGRRMMATETRLMSTLYPTPEVQQERMQELERTRQEQLAAQAAERRRDEQLVSSFANMRPNTAPAPARPWEGTHMSYASGSEQERARKELASQVAEENRRIALAKSLERQQQRQAEAEANRQDMQQHGMQGNFWNLGAVPGTGRYIAPEHRWVAASADSYTPMLSRGASAASTPRGLSAAGSNAPWAPTAVPAAPPAVSIPAAASAYTGLRTPYATTATLPAPVTYSSAAQATAATGMPGVQPSGLSPPWATHSPKAPAPAAAAAVTAPSSPGSIGGSSKSNSFHSRNAGTVMAGLLYGEASESRLQYKRAAAAAAAAEQAGSEEARRFPWSH